MEAFLSLERSRRLKPKAVSRDEQLPGSRQKFRCLQNDVTAAATQCAGMAL